MDEVDRDAPTDRAVTTRQVSRLRSSVGLLATGVVLLACQGDPADDAVQNTVLALCCGDFAVGLVLLALGIFRSAAHVHVLAVRALQQSPTSEPARGSTPRSSG